MTRQTNILNDPRTNIVAATRQQFEYAQPVLEVRNTSSACAREDAGEDEEEESGEEDEEDDGLTERPRRSVTNYGWTPEQHNWLVRYVDQWMARNHRRPAYDDYIEITYALWQKFRKETILKGQEPIGPKRNSKSKRDFWFPNRNHNMVHSHLNRTWKDQFERMCERHFGPGGGSTRKPMKKRLAPEDEGKPPLTKKKGPDGGGGGTDPGQLRNDTL